MVARDGHCRADFNAPMGGVAGVRWPQRSRVPAGWAWSGSVAPVRALELDEQLGHLRELDARSASAWWMGDRSEPQLFTAAIAPNPALLSVSFGADFSWVRRAHDAGIAAATQVGDLRTAARAVEPDATS